MQLGLKLGPSVARNLDLVSSSITFTTACEPASVPQASDVEPRAQGLCGQSIRLPRSQSSASSPTFILAGGSRTTGLPTWMHSAGAGNCGYILAPARGTATETNRVLLPMGQWDLQMRRRACTHSQQQRVAVLGPAIQTADNSRDWTLRMVDGAAGADRLGNACLSSAKR